MDPITISLLAAGGITSLGQTLFGAAQRQSALRDAEAALARIPHSTIPQATKDALASASGSLNAESPATRQLYDQMLRSEATAMNNAERNAPSGAAALSVASNVHQGILDKMPAIAQMSEAYRQQQKANYYNALNEMSRAEQVQQQNEMNRSNQILDFQLGKAGAASQMMSQGLQGIVGTATNPLLLKGISGLK